MKTLLSSIERFYVAIFLILAIVLVFWLNVKPVNSLTQQAEATNSAVLNIPIKESGQTVAVKLDSSGKYFEGLITVKFKDDISDADENALFNSVGATVLDKDIKSKRRLVKVDFANQANALSALKNNSHVEFTELNSKYQIQSCYPNDPYYCDSANYQWGLGSIRASMGWQYSKGSSSTVVAVLDTGVDYTHPDLIQNRWHNNAELYGQSGNDDDGNWLVDDTFGWDFVVNDNNPNDANGHGTLMAGIIAAATNNNLGVAGVNWNAKIMPVRVADENGFSIPYFLAKGINYAVDKGAKVINISIAGDGSSSDLYNAVLYANVNGVLVVAAAQNSSTIDCFMGYPAALPNVISVVALNNINQTVSGCTGNVSPGGYEGGQIDLAAPGSSYSTQNGGGYAQTPGYSTSVATAFVSGVVSVLFPCSLSIVSDCQQGAIDLHSPGWDNISGYGKASLYNSLMNSCFEPIGDVDCSGSITPSDANHILRYVAGLEGMTWNCEPGKMHRPEANVDRDGDVDAVDALYVLQYTAGIRTTQTQTLVPPNIDTDGDGMTNQQESQYSCLNPNVSDSTANPDNDGVTAEIPGPNINISMDNSSEIILGTNPCVSDTDRDGYSDGAEIFIGTKPDKACITSDDDIDMTKLTYPSKTWPADLNAKDSFSRNKINVADIQSYVGIPRIYSTSWGSPAYDMRWDVVPGTGPVPGTTINISDLQSVALGTAPMFNNQRMYGGPTCTP